MIQQPESSPFVLDNTKLMQITAVDVRSTASISIPGANGPLVTIHPDGRLEYGPGYEPDEAARLFWDAMRRWAPSPMEKQFGRPLTERINANLARGQKAEETLRTLALMFEGLQRLLATSSRDWGEYRVDAWLWAVLLGWDCKEDVHDETCVHGAMEEMQQRHGWDDAAVAKARRYRAAVRAVEAFAEEHPAAGHVYLSTGCLHGEHAYCQSMTGQQGEKRPGRCKFCDARCTCSCHGEAEGAA
ncbi:hypothetical protein [Streptomyces sp. rh34]|uniref:hypothetical protein n=1 Tax=Streptomyces sp. rh34 TaxID=2034272 RepID=UPI000BF234FC|nr:hypothetical protein [Streptomyces sp. rh34]